MFTGVRGYFTASYRKFMPPETFDVHFDRAGSRKMVGGGWYFPRLRSRCGAVHIFGLSGHFSWQAREDPRALVV